MALKRGLIALVAVVVLGVPGVGAAAAKPVPATLSIRATAVPSGFTPEQIAAGFPAQGKGLAGRLHSAAPACERNRPLILHYQHPFSEGPVTQDFYADGGRVTTGKDGRWSTAALNLLFFYQPNLVRVSVSTEARGRCAKAKSPTIRVPAVVITLPSG
jgi:hypothetical protein